VIPAILWVSVVESPGDGCTGVVHCCGRGRDGVEVWRGPSRPLGGTTGPRRFGTLLLGVPGTFLRDFPRGAAGEFLERGDVWIGAWAMGGNVFVLACGRRIGSLGG
ncbi:MAG: hypothetical protein ACP5MD_01210, partial [Verrucomicrobiia bacterium]